MPNERQKTAVVYLQTYKNRLFYLLNFRLQTVSHYQTLLLILLHGHTIRYANRAAAEVLLCGCSFVLFWSFSLYLKQILTFVFYSTRDSNLVYHHVNTCCLFGNHIGNEQFR